MTKNDPHSKASQLVIQSFLSQFTSSIGRRYFLQNEGDMLETLINYFLY